MNKLMTGHISTKVEYGSPTWNNYQSGGAVKSQPSLAEELAPLLAELEELEEKAWVERVVYGKEPTRRLIADVERILAK